MLDQRAQAHEQLFPRRSAAPTVTVVFPCLNEAASLPSCMEEARAALADAGLVGEILVVDNGSTDGSAAIARAHGARVVVEPTRGYGSALHRGILEASSDVVVIADADCTYELSAIPMLIAPILADDADLVIAERLRSATTRTMPPLHRYVGTPALSHLIRGASGSGPNVRDSQSGFRAFRRGEVLAFGLHCTGMEFASEMLLRATNAGLRICEVPTKYRVRVGESKLSTLRDGARHVRLITLFAPQTILTLPGLVLLLTGLLLSAYGIVRGNGLEVAGVRWHPVFFASMLTIAGALLLLAGAGVRRFSPFAVQGAGDFGQHRLWLGRIARHGTALAAVGLGSDLVMSFIDFSTADRLGRRIALAGLASSAFIVGLVLILAGLMGNLLLGQQSYLASAVDRREHDLQDSQA